MQKDIAYQNKDITTKFFTDGLKGKTLKAYGMPHIHIVDILPTNLPDIEANELRIDNLLLLSDGSIGIIDYESTYGWEDKIKHVNYIARILKRYHRQGLIDSLRNIRLIIIFTADIENADTLALDVGCMKVHIEPVFLVNLKTNEVLSKIKEKIYLKGTLTDEELMELIILPLTVKGIEEKRKLLKETVEIAKSLTDEKQKIYALSGLLTFSDKFVDREFAKYVREDIRMLKVEQLIYDEGLEAGEKIGEKRGEKRGEKKGEDRFALLTKKLLDASRIDDLFAATNDLHMREALYREYGIKNKR